MANPKVETPMENELIAWCRKVGIQVRRGHDWSVAKASWQEAMRVAMGAVKQVADKKK